MKAEKDNPNPVVYSVAERAPRAVTKKPKAVEVVDVDALDAGDSARDPIDVAEVFEMLRHINDPEHPLTLEQLKVVQEENITVDDEKSRVMIRFTPTIPHCSMATLIGLSLRIKLLRSLPSRFKVDVRITPGTHASEAAINKQLNDKERVAAAMENSYLLDVVNKCLANSD